MGRRVAASDVSRTVNEKSSLCRDVRTCLQKAGKPFFSFWDLFLSTQSALVMCSVSLFSKDVGRWYQFDVQGSNPLGLNCSCVLEFCKGMGYKKRFLLRILLLFCFERQTPSFLWLWGRNACGRGSLYWPQRIAFGLFVVFLEDSLF